MRTLLCLAFVLTTACGSDATGFKTELLGGAGGEMAAGGASGEGSGGSASGGAGGAATGGAVMTTGGASGAGGAAGNPARRACRPINAAPAYEGCESRGACTMDSDCAPDRLPVRCVAGQCLPLCHLEKVDPGIPCDGSQCVWWVGDTEVANPTPDQCAAPGAGFFCGGSESTPATACVISK